MSKILDKHKKYIHTVDEMYVELILKPVCMYNWTCIFYIQYADNMYVELYRMQEHTYFELRVKFQNIRTLCWLNVCWITSDATIYVFQKLREITKSTYILCTRCMLNNAGCNNIRISKYVSIYKIYICLVDSMYVEKWYKTKNTDFRKC